MQQRKSPRASFHNYSGGDYFVTICTDGMRHYFGEIRDGRMLLSAIGQCAWDLLSQLPCHYKDVEVPLFVVMPNHIHAIISIVRSDGQPRQLTGLGVVVAGFKQRVTMFARRNDIPFGWQSRYHDHIIRDNFEGRCISEYIVNNVAKWAEDRFFK